MKRLMVVDEWSTLRAKQNDTLSWNLICRCPSALEIRKGKNARKPLLPV